MKKVLLLLCQGFEEYEASVFTDVFGWSRAYGDKNVIIETVGVRERVQGAFNLLVTPQKFLTNLTPSDYDALAIPGGFETAGFYEDAYSEGVLELIRHFDQADQPIASVCVAALALGKSGVLTGKTGTTYALNGGIRRHQLQAFGVDVLDQEVVHSGNLITCDGPSSALKVAFQLLRRLTSLENAKNVQDAMGFTDAQSGL